MLAPLAVAALGGSQLACNGLIGDVEQSAICERRAGGVPVAEPKLLMNLATDTGWFASPAIVELSDGMKKTRALVVASSHIDVYAPTGQRLTRVAEGGATKGRI